MTRRRQRSCGLVEDFGLRPVEPPPLPEKITAEDLGVVLLDVRASRRIGLLLSDIPSLGPIPSLTETECCSSPQSGLRFAIDYLRTLLRGKAGDRIPRPGRAGRQRSPAT